MALKENIFNIHNHKVNNKYKKNGKTCILDPIREIFLIETPEEIIRQKIIQSLINDYGVPKSKIDIEVPMTYFKKGARGRADIVVYGENHEFQDVPLMIIECKAPNIALTDDVWDQVIFYDSFIEATILIVTNGIYSDAVAYDETKNLYVHLSDIPSYFDITSEKKLKYVNECNTSWNRPEFNKLLSNQVISEFKNNGWVGEDTSENLYLFIFNLICFIQDTDVKFSPFETNRYKVLEDGYRFTSFGNAAGGNWLGDYRYFIVKDYDGNNQIVSISIMGSFKCKNDPVFGNRKANTLLIVSIDNLDKRHNSLQLNLDRYINKNKNGFVIWHDGSITVGKMGAAKRKYLIDFIKDRNLNLLNKDDKIILGEFTTALQKPIEWSQKESQIFIKNLIDYAFIRDEFRNFYKFNNSSFKKK